jgi:hypothetical protein
MEFVTALPVDLTAKTVLMLTPAQPVLPPTQRLSITNASAQLNSSSTVKATVSPVLTVAKSAHQPLSATAALILSSSKVMFAKPAATMDTLYLDHHVSDVPLDVCNALKT